VAVSAICLTDVKSSCECCLFVADGAGLVNNARRNKVNANGLIEGMVSQMSEVNIAMER
jgi:hypothetical protein